MDHQHNRSELHSNDGVSNLNNSMSYSRGAELIGHKGKKTDHMSRSRSNLPRA
ncbi:MAG: hypothetical protein ACK521_00285 [bacterium]